MDTKDKKSGDLEIPSEALKTCPLGHAECLEHRCAFYEQLEDCQSRDTDCLLRQVEAVIKEVMGEGARWLDALLGLSSKGPK